MVKRREVEREEAPDIDQVLLELFAGQLLLAPAEAKLPDDSAVRPTPGPPPRKATAGQRGKSKAG